MAEHRGLTFSGGATYRGATRQQMLDAAMNQPLSLTATVSEMAKENVVKSFGLGTVLRDVTTPEGDVERDRTDLNEAMGPVANPLVHAYRVTKDIAQTFINDDESPVLSEDAYKSSAFYREGVAWDAAMTEQRAAAIAASYDRSKVREFYASKRPITAFIGGLAGQAVDPINYIPVAGPAVKAAAVARLGKVSGAAAHSAIDAAANTAVFSLATRDQRERYGDDVSWQTTVSEIATAALIGSAFGTLGAVWANRSDPSSSKAIENRLTTLKATQEARIALNEAIDAVAHGEDINLSPNSTHAVYAAAEKAARLSPARSPEMEVRNAASVSDVAESLQRVSADHPDLSPTANPTELDRLLIVDLQKRGFDGISAEDQSLPAMPLSFEPDLIDAPVVRKPPTERMIETDIDPKSQEYAQMQIDASEKALVGLERRMAVGERMHNRLLRWADEKLVPGIALGKFDRVGITANLAKLHKENIAQFRQVARGEPPPVALQEAEKRVGKSEDLSTIQDQYRVDPTNGNFAEEADIARMRAEGRLSEDDIASLDGAQAAYDDADAYGEALKSFAACLA